MQNSLQQSLPPMPLNRLEDIHPQMAKAELKKVETVDWRAKSGWIVARTFQLAGVTHKEGAALMDRDQGQIARWITGIERHQQDAMLAVDAFRSWYPVAVAEAAGVEVETTIHVRRVA